MSVGVLLFLLAILYWNAVDELDDELKKDVIVAVLDTGYCGENVRVLEGIATIGRSQNVIDRNGHGTRIIELILSESEPNVKILPIKIADYTGCSNVEAAYEGVKYAIEHNVDIIHMSLNMNRLSEDSKLREIFTEASEAGIEIVVSAGNGSKNVDTVFPADIEEAIVVSAVNEKGEICSYTNFGKTIDFAADGYYKGESGTSYSAARVTAKLADEYGKGGNLETLQEKAVDAGTYGKDIYYGYGILKGGKQSVTATDVQACYGNSRYDIGYKILEIDWKETDADLLDKYFVETHSAYVGMYLSKLDEEELEQVKKKSTILNSNVLVQNFDYVAEGKRYEKESSYEENFAINAIKEYQEHEEQLTISAEWLILKKYGYFVISSENREDIYYFRINGFSYTTVTPESEWFEMFKPENLSVTRTTVKQ